jgi:hypothetical protein
MATPPSVGSTSGMSPEPAASADPPTVEPLTQPTVHDPPQIPLLRWPTQDDRRHRLAALGKPRLLLVPPDSTPPALLDDLELWVHDGDDPDAILAAVTALQDKVRQKDTHPILDTDGLLWFRGRWVAVSDTQIPVVDLLVRNYQRLVHNDDIQAAYRQAGGGTSPASLRTLVRRIGQRLTKVGLKLRVVRTRGVMLTLPDHDRHHG